MSRHRVGKYCLGMRIECHCGQVRAIATTKDARGHPPGEFTMPCCLARYNVVRWVGGAPEVELLGHEVFDKKTHWFVVSKRGKCRGGEG